ncbi:hypothetical protein GGX14DRAFT_362171 [Mycena pura]|uniref:F-box domain-containing protein n=1 Tax=Mycena pura TaxID=153505 RepID=A0AAD6VK94_9AGAR|nr:hypothetical protein GGX14DRAFT_362171 [Mycena pura]
MHLPDELICLVLAKAYYKDPPLNTPDYSTLSACSLVSSSWTHPAQILLFRCITQDVAHAFSRFAETNDQALLANVRTFSIALLTQSVDLPILVSVLRRCPQLYELTISARGLFSFPDESIAALVSIMNSTGLSIRSLRLIECSVQSPILYQLMGVFPTIEFLTLGVELAATPPLWKPICALYELKCHRTLSPEMLVWLLSSSASSLRVLELRDLPSARTAVELAPYCESIQSLRLMRYNAHTAAILRQCTNLLELVLLNVPTLVSLPSLPPSLEHITLLIQTYTTSVDLTPVIVAVNSLPNLRTLSFMGDLGQIAVLQSVCDSKNVSLWRTSQKFWTMDDPIKATRFPRRQSVSNFYLMK